MTYKRRPPAIEWYLFLARCLLFSVALVLDSLAPQTYARPQILYVSLIVGAGFNLVYALYLLSGTYSPFAAAISQLIDVATLLAVLYSTEQGYSPLFVFAAIPVLAGTLRFGRAVSVPTATILILGYGAKLFIPGLQAPPQTVTVLFGTTALSLLLLAAFPYRDSRIASPAAGEDHDSEAAQLSEAHTRLRTLYELTSTLSSTLSFERVFDALLATSEIGLAEPDEITSSSVRLVLLYSSQRTLYVAAARNVGDVDRSLTISDQAGLVQQTLAAAEPTIGTSVDHDPELKRFTALADARSLLCVPLRAGFDVFGVMLLASPKPDAYAEEHIELIEASCNQAVIALQNAQLYQNVEADKQRLLDTQEEIRRQLARELHDGPTQVLSAIAMRLSFAKTLVARDPERTVAELEKLERTARKTTTEIRTMLFALRPLSLEAQGLTVALQQYAGRIQETDGLEVVVDSDVDVRLSPTIEGVVFSIVEEAINNARKHARANDIRVRLRLQQDLLLAEVTDDGRGFDLAAVEKEYDQRGSLGLANMRERASLISGALTIDSRQGQGTSVTLLVPLSSADFAASQGAHWESRLHESSS